MKAEQSHLQLLERMRRGETAALGIVLERHSTAVVEYVTTLLRSIDAAEDAAQEAFVRLWERREKWKLEGSLRGLLLRIARNAALDDRRRRLTLEGAAQGAGSASGRPLEDGGARCPFLRPSPSERPRPPRSSACLESAA